MKKIDIVLPEKLGTIAPELYGQFAEHIGGVMRNGAWVGKNAKVPNIRGWRTEIVEKMKKIHVPVVRWPGGCFAETYDWRDGIGENRPTRLSWWTGHDGRYETNEVGTHEFMDFCELVGCKAYVAMNVTSITPLQARDWMDYCLSPAGTTTLALERERNGHKEPFDIAYWGVGNENWGGGGNMDAETYGMEFRRFATVMKNTAGKTETKLIAGGADGADYQWTKGLSKKIAEARDHRLAQGMSFHYYCGSAGLATDYTDDDWYTLIHKAERMEELIRRHYAATVADGTDKQLPLVIDEWGCWHKDGSGPSAGYNLFEQQSTMRDAVVAALTLNLFNNNCDKIMMANVAQLCNNLHSLFLADETHCVATVNYHVFDLYQAHQGATAVRSFVENEGEENDLLSVSASVKDNVLTLTVANLNCESAQTFEPVLFGGKHGKMTVRTLSCNDLRACNTFDEPEKIVPVTTVTEDDCITVPAAGVVSVSTDLVG